MIENSHLLQSLFLFRFLHHGYFHNEIPRVHNLPFQSSFKMSDTFSIMQCISTRCDLPDVCYYERTMTTFLEDSKYSLTYTKIKHSHSDGFKREASSEGERVSRERQPHKEPKQEREIERRFFFSEEKCRRRMAKNHSDRI